MENKQRCSTLAFNSLNPYYNGRYSWRTLFKMMRELKRLS